MSDPLRLEGARLAREPLAALAGELPEGARDAVAALAGELRAVLSKNDGAAVLDLMRKAVSLPVPVALERLVARVQAETWEEAAKMADAAHEIGLGNALLSRAAESRRVLQQLPW